MKTIAFAVRVLSPDQMLHKRFALLPIFRKTLSRFRVPIARPFAFTFQLAPSKGQRTGIVAKQFQRAGSPTGFVAIGRYSIRSGLLTDQSPH